MGNIYRMPVNFGPSWGPRQGPGGRRFTGMHATTYLNVSFLTDPAQLAQLLPPGHRPAAEPVVTIRSLYNRSFVWLAGRAYNYVEVLFRSVFEGERDKVEGEFVAVMWESMADAAFVGRDEAGHPKLFAEVPDPVVRNGTTYGEASWYGFKFYECSFPGLELGPWPTEKEATAPYSPPSEMLLTRPRLNYKYFPNAEDMEKADVAYTVMAPAGHFKQQVLERWSGPANFKFNPARWEDLPTFGNISNALAELKVVENRGGSMVRMLREFNDLRGTLKILR